MKNGTWDLGLTIMPGTAVCQILLNDALLAEHDIC